MHRPKSWLFSLPFNVDFADSPFFFQLDLYALLTPVFLVQCFPAKSHV